MSKNSTRAVCLALGLALVLGVSLPGAQAQMSGSMGSGPTLPGYMGGGTPMGNAAMPGMHAGSRNMGPVTMTPGLGMGPNMGAGMRSRIPGNMTPGVMGSGPMGAGHLGGGAGGRSMGPRAR